MVIQQINIIQVEKILFGGGTYNTFSNDNDGNGPYYRINFQYNSFW